MACCLVAAGGGAITAATHLVARDYLTRQADQQLRSYADQLTSRPLTLFPGFRVAPGASGFGDADRALSIAVRGANGQLLMTAGPATPPAASGNWLEISEPVSYQAEHIAFVYGADDSSLSITGETGRGLPGRLVIGLDLASAGRTVASLTVICLQVTGLAVLLAAGAAAWVTRMLLRRVVPTAETGAADEAAARDVAERTSAAVAAACGKMRRPLSVLAGLAEHYRERGELTDDDADRTLRRVAHQAGRLAELVEELRAAARGGPAAKSGGPQGKDAAG